MCFLFGWLHTILAGIIINFIRRGCEIPSEIEK